MKYIVAAGLLVVAVVAQSPRPRDWPAVTREARPWTRWWWHGSAVDAPSLTANLRAIAAAGMGGVEITPIFGVRGEESRFIPYLSPRWIEMLRHSLSEARRLDLGVDMATGTGWPFGGPSVDDESAARNIVHRVWRVPAGGSLPEPIQMLQPALVRTARPLAQGRLDVTRVANPVSATPDLQALALEHVKYPRPLPLIAVMAYDASGRSTDLTNRVGADGVLGWVAPEASTVYALFGGWHGKMVERAAPGGEGFVIDHFSGTAIRSYLAGFDRAWPERPAGVRAFFNDSYEVDDAPGQADWTPRLLEEFRVRRGYDLRERLPELFGDVGGDDVDRVLADYRETISDLLLETFTAEWGAWARSRGALTRNQAHGSPANLLDLYAASDIPETEGTDLPRFRWASSAGHVAGRHLISAEAATWLDEHFRATLAQVRSAVDDLFLGGVNHIVYHGTAYSPPGDAWPGWQFYAAVEFNPANAWWDDLAALNAYVTRTQSFLQSGRADQDVLLYFPFYDAIAARGNAGLLTHFGDANQRTAAEGFEAAASLLQTRGYTFDYVSDRQVQALRVSRGRIGTSGGAAYRAIVIPPVRFIPVATLEHLLSLARQGAQVIVWKAWPSAAAGFADRASSLDRLRQLIAAAPITIDGDLEGALARTGVERETLVDHGLGFVRRADAAGRVYFVANRTARAIDGWIPFRLRSRDVTIFNAATGRRGRALTRDGDGGAVEVFLALAPRESLLVAGGNPARDAYDFYAASGTAVAIDGSWRVRFIKGGPTLPAARTVDRLRSWTEFDGDDVKSFSGTAAYIATFARPAVSASAWQLDLGAVHESARLRLNGHEVGTLIGPPYRVTVAAAALTPTNTLEVSVTNLSANRIAALDRRGIGWKKFYNVNMPSRFPQNRGADGLFSAAAWEPLPSGLLGPVTLTPMRVRRGE